MAHFPDRDERLGQLNKSVIIHTSKICCTNFTNADIHPEHY